MKAGTTSTRIVFVVVLSGLCGLVQQGCSRQAPQETSQTYDLVIAGGRVIDPETKLDAVRNVGIANGTIAVVTEQTLSGKETIDAKGLVVAPGFIDPHVHAYDAYGNKLLLRDGVTTALDLELGAWPLDGFYAEKAGKWPLNYGASAGHAWARMFVMDGVDCKGTGIYSGCLEQAINDGANFNLKQATPEQVTQIVAKIDEAVRDGGLGIGFPIGYYTAVSSDEVMKVAAVAGRYGQFITTHVRYLSQVPPSGYLGLEEMLAVAALNKAPLLMHHVHSSCLALTVSCLEAIDLANTRGLKVAAEFYPYDRGQTMAGADYLAPDTMAKQIGMDFSDLTVAATGQTMTRESWVELRKTAPTTMMILHHIKEQDMLAVFKHEGAFLGSDSGNYLPSGKEPLTGDSPYGYGAAHPRAAGARARVLRMVREQNVVPLTVAVAKLSYDAAKWLEDMVPDLRHRGRVSAGTIADITIFDPETVTDNATFELGKNSLPSTGIPYVIVNGVIVVKNSEIVKDVYPGRPIRNAPRK